MKLRILFLNIFLFFSPWLWQIYKSNLLLLIILIIFTNILYLSLIQSNKLFKIILILSYFFISILYYKTTLNKSIINLSTTQVDIQQKRLTYYPILIRPFYHLPIFLETSPIMLSIYKLENNLTNIFDPNYYFWTSHPRSTQIPGEFQKLFPITLIFILYGTYKFPFKKQKLFINFLSLSLLLVSLIGDHNHLGIFPIFPFLIILITFGFTKLIIKPS